MRDQCTKLRQYNVARVSIEISLKEASQPQLRFDVVQLKLRPL
jgi:hypothetical protein